jgi:hypothetical protein
MNPAPEDAETSGAVSSVTPCPTCHSKKTEIPHRDPLRYQCRACGCVWYPKPPFAWAPTGEVAGFNGRRCIVMVILDPAGK